MKNINHDFSLHSGERQVATTYGDIRADHRFRYEWTDHKLPKNGFGLDAFCGNGYGTWLLSKKRIVWGLDASVEAIRMAEEAYASSRAFFSTARFPFELPLNVFDFAVSLESVEHVEDGQKFFEALAGSIKPGGHLVFSTPCEERLPHSSTGNHFHYKHYTFDEAKRLIEDNGLDVIEWAGQDTYTIQPNGMQGSLLADEEVALKPNAIGQFLIFLCQKRPLGIKEKIRLRFKL